MTELAERVIAELNGRGESIAVAESLTGGLLAAELVSVPGASAVLNGAVVAYSTELKNTLLGVDAGLLAQRGAVDADVARQMAAGVRSVLAVGGVSAAWGLATTGVAGPDPQDGATAGTVFVAVAGPAGIVVRELSLDGDRSAVRAGSVQATLELLWQELTLDPDHLSVP